MQSLRYMFSDSKIKKKKKGNQASFSFLNSKTKKMENKHMICCTYFRFWSKATSSVMPSFAFPFGGIQLEKEIRNQTIICSCSNRPFAVYPIIVISQNSHWRQYRVFIMLLPRQGMVVRVVAKGVTEPRCGGLAWFPWCRTPDIHVLLVW